MKKNKLKIILNAKKFDFALFYNLDPERCSPNMFYLSNYSGIGALILPKKAMPFLIVPKMEFEKAKKSSVKKVYEMDKKKFFESIRIIAGKNRIKAKNIAIDDNNFNLNMYRQLKKQFKKARTKDISLDCLRLREIKNTKEIHFLKKSSGYANNILKKAISNFGNFKTESEVAAFLEYETKRLGLQLSFPPIVASGSNSSMPHHEPKDVKLKNGFCVIDFGVKYNGYCSDMTRTIYLGTPDKKEKEIYRLVLKSQQDTINGIETSDECGKIFNGCVESLGKYSRYFIHGLGHGVGVQIHELPNLTLDSRDKISKNMVFTVEPGIYIPKRFGIRIEDTLMMKDRPIVLTKMTKELIIKA